MREEVELDADFSRLWRGCDPFAEVARLEGEEFPHEIGLFLGYPPEDVEGFCRYQGQNYKLCGRWKVYGDREAACRRFQRYDHCRDALCRRLAVCPLLEVFHPVKERSA